MDKVATVCEIPVRRRQCRHYWLIERATGSISIGICHLCGAQREFHNDLKDCIRPDKEEFMERLRGYNGRSGHPERECLSQIEDLLRTFAN